MSDPAHAEQALADRKFAQLRQAAEIIGTNQAYLTRMLEFFVARIRAYKQLCRVFEGRATDDLRSQVERMKAFWHDAAVHDGRCPRKLIEAHRDLPGLRREDFDRWLELFRATLDETAPTPEAANYLRTRAERIAQDLQAAICDSGLIEAVPPRERAKRG